MACDALTRAAANCKRQKLGQAMQFANTVSG